MLVGWLVAACASAISCGLLGVYLVGFELPLIGIAMAHCALAGAVMAQLVGWPIWPLAAGAALGAGFLLARLARSQARVNLGAVTSIILSGSMGLAFLGIGMASSETSSMLGLLWGNILFVTPFQAAVLAALALLVLVLVWAAGPMLDALIFCRRSDAYAFDPRYVLTAFMAVASLVITANLQFVGGLLIYALLANPAAAAYELGETMRAVRWISVAGSLASTLGGLALSWVFDLPTGASIVVVTTLFYALALAVQRRRARSA